MYEAHIQEKSTSSSYPRLQTQPQATHMFSSFDQIDHSRSLFWHRMYQVSPNTQCSFFPKTKQDSKEKASSTVGQAWGKFNPEKEPSYELDVFKMMKEGKETTGTKSKALQQNLSPPKIQLAPHSEEVNFFQPKKPPPFMGAFSHVQTSSFFPLNISIPTAQEYRPFSCFYEDQQQEIYQNLHLEVSKISAIKDIKQQNNIKYFFEIDSAESEISEIADQPQPQPHPAPTNHLEDADKSLLWNYAVLFEERGNFKHRDPMWEQAIAQRGIIQSRIFQVNRQDSLKTLHKMECELNLAEQMREVLSDQYVLSQVSKMMQNVESQLFTLNYSSLQWSIDLGRWRLEHIFKNSLRNRLGQLMTMASQRSRIDVALQYIRKRPYRRVYYELGLQAAQIQILFQEIVLQAAKECSLIEFFLRVERLKSEISLLYHLLINQSYVVQEERSYEDFDYRFLNSQYVIFKQVLKQARTSDSLQNQSTPLISTLLVAVFKPITSILSTLLFEESNTIELNDEIYLKYYFESHKDLLNLVSRKIALIKEESQELYQVCRMSDRIEILEGLTELEEYEHRWERTFARKRKLIQRIRKNYRLKLRSQRQKRHQERMKFIYSLKSRIYQQQQQENTRNRNTAQTNREELERLKKEIETRQERRKLLEMMEREKERGLMLDIQLKEKMKLQREKDLLMQQLGQQEETKNQPKQAVNEDKNKKDIKSDQILNDLPHQEESIPVDSTSLKQQSSIKKPTKQQSISSIKQNEKEGIKNPGPISQDHIPSTNSIEGNMIFTADHFFRKDRHSSKISNNTQSYFRLQAQRSFEIDSASADSSMELQQPSSEGQEDFQPFSLQLGIDRPLDLTTSLQICLGQVIRKQVAVVESSLRFLIVEKYQVLEILDFLRRVFLAGNGQRVQEFMLVAIDERSLLNLKYFSQCLLFDTPHQLLNRLEPAFYHSKSENRYDTQISIFDENVQNYIGFQFRKLPVILQPYFSYIHLSKYMQIFGFILRLKYSEHLVTHAWKLLNNFKKELERRQREGEDVEEPLGLMGRMYQVRYIINSFLITYQNYLFLKVIEKEFKILKLSVSNLHDLEANHLKMLDNISRFAFIDNPNQNVSKNFRKNLNYIHEFYQIVYQLTLDDIPSYRWEETLQKLQLIYLSFKKQQQYIENLTLKLI